MSKGKISRRALLAGTAGVVGAVSAKILPAQDSGKRRRNIPTRSAVERRASSAS